MCLMDPEKTAESVSMLNDGMIWSFGTKSFRFQKLNSSLGPPTHPTTPNQQKTNQTQVELLELRDRRNQHLMRVVEYDINY